MQQATIYEGKFIGHSKPIGWWDNPIEGFGPYIFHNIIARDYVVCGYTNSTYSGYTDTLWLESKTGMTNDVIRINFLTSVSAYEQFLHGKTLTFKGCTRYDHAVGQWYIHWVIA